MMIRLQRAFLRITERLQKVFQNSSPGARRGAAMLVDVGIVVESFAIALLFRFAGDVPANFWSSFWPFAFLCAAIFVALLYESGVYQSVLRYTGIYQGVRVASATSIATGIIFIVDVILGAIFDLRPFPLSVVVVGSVLAYLQLVAVRLYPRFFYELSLREIGTRTRTVIVGTEEPGVALASHIWRSTGMNLQVVGFVSESPAEAGRRIEGAPVLGGLDDLGSIIPAQDVQQVIIATPYADWEQMNSLWRVCTEASVAVKIMPDLDEVLSENAFRLRELQIEDLLGREPVNIDLAALSEHISGKRVLVTGAGGSIGRELSRQISRLVPEHLTLVDRDESGLYYLSQDLAREGFAEAKYLVGDVTSPEGMEETFERFSPQVVFHAAAYKHVPLMEERVAEAVVNNVFGTLNVARLSGAHGVEKFVNVSTDKAVNPANVMGATKRLAEMLVQSLSREYPATIYASVRFGNVLGSRGSVVPTFRQQIEAGGPVTVTHPEMIRYFMTIPEAVSLILQASAMADSYGTYVLEMGRPVSITELATKMIEIMGARGVEIKYTGLRPGEKLQEELLEDTESQNETKHPMVFRVAPENPETLDTLETNGAPRSARKAYGGFEGSEGDDRFLQLVGEMVSRARCYDSEGTTEMLRAITPNYASAGLSGGVRRSGSR
jgi:FlaA1/EpsC-like NDP-sugar epimerase